MWWAPVERWAEGQPLTHLSFPPLLAPLQLGCLQSPHESPEPGAGQTGGCAVMGGGGAEPPAHLDCRPSTVRGRCPQPLGFYSCTAEYLMPGAAPPGAAPSFIFLTKKKDKRRAGGRWRCAAVCLLCGWGSAWHGGRGSYGAPAAPFRGRAHVLPPRSHRGIRVAWHSLKGWAEGQSRAGLRGSWPWCLCLRQECSPRSPLPRWTQPPSPQPAWHPGAVACSAQPCQLPALSPFPAKCFI